MRHFLRLALAALVAGLWVFGGSTAEARTTNTAGSWSINSAVAHPAVGSTPCNVVVNVDHSAAARVLVTYYNAAGEPAPYSSLLTGSMLAQTVTVSLPVVYGPERMGDGVTATVELDAQSGRDWAVKAAWPQKLGPINC